MTISRRKLIISPLGALLLKPFVDFIEARADGPTIPGCFVLMHKCQGLYPADKATNWLPQEGPGGLVLSPVFANLEKIKQTLSFVSGLDLTCFGGNDWHHASKAIFTGARFEKSGEISPIAPNHESIDQFIAARWGTEPLHLDFNNYDDHVANSPSESASWRRDAGGNIVRARPVTSLIESYRSFFGKAIVGQDSASVLKQIEAANRSLLDSVSADIKSVQGQVVGSHKQQLESHLEGFRAVEKQLFNQPASVDANVCRPTGENAFALMGSQVEQDRLLARIELQRKFLLLIMKCGLRRVFNFTATSPNDCNMRPVFWNPEFGPPKDFDGECVDSSNSYHNCVWHKNGFADGQGHIKTETFVTSFFTKLLLEMHEISNGDKTMLENSLCIYGTTMSYNHSNNAHSFLVAGNAGGNVPGNRILKFGDSSRNAPTNVPHNDLLVSLCQGVGLRDVKTFGDPSLCKGGLSGFLKS